jgi:PIN domain nuclease of toxin-antitoxin system
MIVLDTHAWVWYASGSAELSERSRKAIESAAVAGLLYLSSVSALEVAMLGKRGRLQLTIDVRDWIARAEMLPGLRIVPVDNHIAVKSVFLPPPLHSDPADRIIVATALTLGATLITRDERLRQYHFVKTHW